MKASKTTHELLDPFVLAKVKDLPLVARTVAQGVLHGRHSSVQRGTGTEFNQYRSYEPGDGLNQIDWKLFARSDRYFVREAERESNINVWLIVDASLSMLQGSENAWHKLDYAKHLLATFAYMAHQQGDAFGLLGLSSQQLTFLPALNGHQQWQKVLMQLSNLQAGEVFPEPRLLTSYLEKMQSNSLIFVVSDFYQQNTEIIDFMSQLLGSNTEVIGVQLESDEEIHFPYKGQIRFEDRETKTQILVSGQEARADYLKARDEFNQGLADTFSQKNIQHLKANIDQPLDHSLHHFLAARQAMTC